MFDVGVGEDSLDKAAFVELGVWMKCEEFLEEERQGARRGLGDGMVEEGAGDLGGCVCISGDWL